MTTEEIVDRLDRIERTLQQLVTQKTIKEWYLSLGDVRSYGQEQMNTLETAVQSYPVMEQITFTYESITITYQPEGMIATDNWEIQT